MDSFIEKTTSVILLAAPKVENKGKDIQLKDRNKICFLYVYNNDECF